LEKEEKEQFSKIKLSTTVAQRCQSGFENMRVQTDKINQMVTEIAVSSESQMTQLEKMKAAMDRLKLINQENFRFSKETSNASSELDENSQQLKKMVIHLADSIQRRK
jgi:methyl-accepting chemotaxis protein